MQPPILIVLYEPTKSSINRLLDLEDKVQLFLFDNSRESSKISHKTATYFYSKTNTGIAGALRWMIKQCKKNHFDYFLFFDQDTIFSHLTIKSIASQIPESDTQIAIAHFSSESKKKGSVRFVINSGTLFFIKPLELISNVLERYFVDAVDLAICHHCRYLGYKVNCGLAPDIDHIAEQGIQKWKLFGLLFSGKIYNKDRRVEFYKSHIRLIIDCIKNRSLSDALILVKFTISYIMHQFKCDTLNLIAKKA